MDEILQIVKNVTIFILIFTIILNLFSDSEYIRYFSFVEGILVIMLVMTPLFSGLADGHIMDGHLERNMSELEDRSYEKEIERMGRLREKMLRELSEGEEAALEGGECE